MIFAIDFLIEISLLFEAVLTPKLAPKGQPNGGGCQRPGQGLPGGSYRLDFRASNAKARPLENIGRADANAGSGPQRRDTAAPLGRPGEAKVRIDWPDDAK